MPRQRMSVKEERQTARSLDKSLKSTAEGLAVMAQSLERGGFKQALAPYQQMQHILLQQRLWAVNYKRKELNPRWQAIAEQATAIHAILAPFTSVMNNLKDLDRITTVEDAAARAEASAVDSAPEAAPPPPEVEAQHPETPAPDPLLAEFAALLVDELKISGVRLTRALDCPAEERRTLLRELTATGLLEPGGWGRGRRYRLSAKGRAWLAEELVNHLAAQEAESSSDAP